MNKTTVYLPEGLKQALQRTAAASGRSEADLIRAGVEIVTSRAERPRPRGGLFAGDGPPFSDDVDEALAGFGED
ncbi:MAG TPA: CopG family transcriptional regulator [Solirubrobacteraceae bacterium]|nr:CopG family transcriptional regulator [Solirubrobacteraceae bacterium]